VKYLSVCSGIEAASVAWHPLGWEPVAFSEIESFPSAVLAHRFPSVPNLGDMTKFKEWKIGRIDALVGGTPCQSFSVAGLRRGLADPRGNLMLVYGAIADHFRPSWIVWENVPGVLSSNGGRDFGTFLGMLGELGYGFAYRVLDAQFFGVPQRRRRVFVVGYFGDWRPAAAVLFESESMCGDTPPSREARESLARGVEFGPSGGSFTDINPTLDARCKDGPVRNQLAGAVIMAHGQANAEIRDDGGAPALTCNHEAPILAHAIQAGAVRENPNSGPDGVGVQEEVAYTLEARSEVQMVSHTLRGSGFDASEDGTGRGTPLVPVNGFHWQNGFGVDGNGDLCGTLIKNQTPAAQIGTAVRRLTPRECERLQGFPDDWTLIPWRGKPAPDGPRYKACGNSMAVPVMRWIGERIVKAGALKWS
jgi:DNA (cytosine-5)-methyltransferase 1